MSSLMKHPILLALGAGVPGPGVPSGQMDLPAGVAGTGVAMRSDLQERYNRIKGSVSVLKMRDLPCSSARLGMANSP